ncbi:MAG: hypothetical protein II992_13515 [Lachnospiraceae bacterium]|nr:hypothetical protein [Lachnospiraceae bacterium]MBQ6695992.1 hypothetical protein [Lachnospiraceae bacterium]
MEYEFEEARNQEVGAAGAVVGLLVGLAGIGIKKMIDSNNTNKEQQKARIQEQIYVRENRIRDLRSRFLGSVLYADEIEKLEKEVRRLKECL